MTDSDQAGGRGASAVDMFALRGGGTLIIAPDGFYVERPDQETIYVDFENVVEVQHRSFDYSLGVLSVLLAAFGVLSLSRNVLAGLTFVAAGVVSLYLTYRKRNEFSFKVANRPKPLSVYPENVEGVYHALGETMAGG